MAFSYAAAAQSIVTLLQTARPEFGVLFAQQGATRPTPPYWGLKVGDVAVVGTADAISETFDSTQIGQELQRQVLGVRVWTVSLQAYCVAKLGDPDPALAAMAQVAMLLQLPGQQDAFTAVGLGLAEVGAIQNISALLQNDWESRANLDLRFILTDDATQKDGYVAQVIPPVGTLTY